LPNARPASIVSQHFSSCIVAENLPAAEEEKTSREIAAKSGGGGSSSSVLSGDFLRVLETMALSSRLIGVPV
jgi:hypothetical protein